MSSDRLLTMAALYYLAHCCPRETLRVVPRGSVICTDLKSDVAMRLVLLPTALEHQRQIAHIVLRLKGGNPEVCLSAPCSAYLDQNIITNELMSMANTKWSASSAALPPESSS